MDFRGRHQRLSAGGPISIPSLSGFAFREPRGRSALWLFWILMAGVALQPQAEAASIPCPLDVFTLVNSNSDGTAVSPDGGVSVILTGGNNGSGLAGTTDLLAMAVGAGTIEFQYTYSSVDAPGFDWAGYLIGDQFTQLADTNGQFGTATFSVAGGDTFGFRVGTFDNTTEPGVFAISDFSTPASSVPEPSAWRLVLATAVAMAVGVGRRRNIQRIQEKRQ